MPEFLVAHNLCRHLHNVRLDSRGYHVEIIGDEEQTVYEACRNMFDVLRDTLALFHDRSEAIVATLKSLDATEQQLDPGDYALPEWIDLVYTPATNSWSWRELHLDLRTEQANAN